jgi:hypothetical protein
VTEWMATLPSYFSVEFQQQLDLKCSFSFKNKIYPIDLSDLIIQKIILHAREVALPFYRQLSYQLDAPSHLLFGEIQHFLMHKLI